MSFFSIFRFGAEDFNLSFPCKSLYFYMLRMSGSEKNLSSSFLETTEFLPVKKINLFCNSL